MSVNVHFNGDASGFKSASDKASNYLQRFERQTSKSFGRIKATSLGVLGALGLSEISSQITAAFADYDKVDKFAKRLDATTETIQRLGNAAELEGASLDEIVNSVTRLSRKVAEGGKGVTEALDVLNISASDLQNANPFEQILLLSDAYTKAEDKGKAFAALFKVLEDDAKKLIPLLSRGRETIGSLANEMETLDSAGVQSVVEFNDELSKLKKNLSVGLMESFSLLMPDIADGLTVASKSLVSFSKFLADNRDMVRSLGAAWLTYKATGIVISLASQRKSTVANTLAAARQQGVIATLVNGIRTETQALQQNTQAQNVNATSRGGNVGGSGAAKAAGLSFGQVYAQSAKAGLIAQAAPMAIGMAGALSSTMIPESQKLGGTAGTALIDGMSGVLAAFGPYGIVAALGLQAAKFGVAAGRTLGEALATGVQAELSKITIDNDIFNFELDAAVQAGDEAKARELLNAKLKEYNRLSEEGKGLVQQNAQLQKGNLGFQLENLGRLIQAAKDRAAAEAEVAQEMERQQQLPILLRSDLSKNLQLELDILDAKSQGFEGVADMLEREKEIRRETQRIAKQEKTDLDDARRIAVELVDMRREAKRVAEEQKRIDELNNKTLEERKKLLEDLAGKSAAFDSNLIQDASLQDQLAFVNGQIQGAGGASSAETAAAARKAQEAGNLENAQYLFDLADKLLNLERQRQSIQEQIADAAKREADEAQRIAGNLEAFRIELKAKELEAQGRKTEAEALREKLRILERAKVLQEQLQVSQEKALELALKENQLETQGSKVGKSGKGGGIKRSENDRIHRRFGSVNVGSHRDAGLKNKIHQDAQTRTALTSTANQKDPSLTYLSSMEGSLQEMAKIWQGLGVV